VRPASGATWAQGVPLGRPAGLRGGGGLCKERGAPKLSTVPGLRALASVYRCRVCRVPGRGLVAGLNSSSDAKTGHGTLRRGGATSDTTGRRAAHVRAVGVMTMRG